MKSEPEDLPRFKRRCAVAVAAPQSMETIWFVVGFNRKLYAGGVLCRFSVVLFCGLTIKNICPGSVLPGLFVLDIKI